MYTTQTLFNTVAAHLLTQGKKATVMDSDDAELCRYRGDGGTKCAIGCLIPDELYRPKMEGRNIGSLIYDNEFGLISLFAGVNKGILGQLQRVHDNYPPEQWLRQLLGVGLAYNLDTDILSEF